ncbi:MAG: CarD family transcriptional regulator [Spirochaetota bacterium]
MYKVGDKIVYPMHGIGVIEAIEKKTVLNKKDDYYIITIVNSGMKVMIPVKNADSIGIRGIIQKKEISKVLSVLKKTNQITEEDWKIRYQNNIDKVKSGSILKVAEVLRDLYQRGKEKDLSIMERKLYENAYQFIIYEIAYAKDVEIEDSGNLVSDALSTT